MLLRKLTTLLLCVNCCGSDLGFRASWTCDPEFAILMTASGHALSSLWSKSALSIPPDHQID